MRLSPFILGVFAAASALKNPLRRKAAGGAPTTTPGTAARRIAGSQRSNNAWPTCAGSAGTVDPVRTRPRRSHVRQIGPGDARRLLVTQ